jgi:hypothetical protein
MALDVHEAPPPPVVAGPLIGTDLANLTSAAQQGSSVSISADGRTLAVGGRFYNSSVGGVWVWEYTSGGWRQATPIPLVGRGYIITHVPGGSSPTSPLQPGVQQGYSLDLSANGSVLAVGGPCHDDNVGGVWVFERTSGGWVETTSGPLTPKGATGVAPPFMGYGLSLSNDGNTLAVGGPDNNNTRGGVWTFQRQGDSWVQATPRPLIGSGSVTAGAANQGWSVSLSADASILAVGGPADNDALGGTFLFRREGDDEEGGMMKWVQDPPAPLLGAGYVDNKVSSALAPHALPAKRSGLCRASL